MARRAIDANGELLEWAWQQRVVNLARFHGWLVYHPPDNRVVTAKSGRAHKQDVAPGFPDLTLVRGRELVFAELKTNKGRTSPDQDKWLFALADVPAVEVYVWRPRQQAEVEQRLGRACG